MNIRDLIHMHGQPPPGVLEKLKAAGFFHPGTGAIHPAFHGMMQRLSAMKQAPGSRPVGPSTGFGQSIATAMGGAPVTGTDRQPGGSFDPSRTSEGTGGFSGRGPFGPFNPAYQGFLQSLQERRDARSGVPAVPPQGAASPSAQRRVPSMFAGAGRSF